MFAGKGDNAFGFRTTTTSLDFFVYAGGAWRSIYYEMGVDAASGWVGKKHQVAGIYDAESNMLRVYADGKMLGEKEVGTTAGVAHSGYNLTLGACPDTGRNSQAEFYEMRVYSKALTAAADSDMTESEFLRSVENNLIPMQQFFTYYKCAIMEIETKFRVLNEQFSINGESNPIEFIQSRIKSYGSIFRKMIAKDLPRTLDGIEKNVSDIAGIRVVCSFVQDIS